MNGKYYSRNNFFLQLEDPRHSIMEFMGCTRCGREFKRAHLHTALQQHESLCVQNEPHCPTYIRVCRHCGRVSYRFFSSLINVFNLFFFKKKPSPHALNDYSKEVNELSCICRVLRMLRCSSFYWRGNGELCLSLATSK